jgi:DNA topoisomerase-6 subunit B
VYRGNPFVIEVGLAYGGGLSTQRVTREGLAEMLGESDARTLRQFLVTTFDGLGAEAADRILEQAKLGTRLSPGRLGKEDIDHLHDAMQHVNVHDGQTMTILRYANRVPLQFQASACAITQMVMGTNWRSYGLSQSRGALPSGPITLMVHMASVWVPFTSESKEAVASYPEIQRELRLALQSVGRKLGMYLRRHQKVKHEGQRRQLFLRYLSEVADAVSEMSRVDRDNLYEQLLRVAKRKTADADARFDDRGRRLEEEEEAFGENVIIVDPEAAADAPAPETDQPSAPAE